MKTAKPGLITANLREALGMEEAAPPPWLINMQRYGPPPSYPELPVRPSVVYQEPLRLSTQLKRPSCSAP